MNSLPAMQSAAVIGAGSWGTTQAAMLAWRGIQVQFWGRDASLMAEIAATRKNPRYLPHLELPSKVEVVTSAADLKPVDMLVFVVPSKGIREAAELIATTPAAKSRVVVSCAKGIEMNTGLRMSQILAESLRTHRSESCRGSRRPARHRRRRRLPKRQHRQSGAELLHPALFPLLHHR
jgi:glycerol-3-phosphate dehydrogenase (NAD(P)+)